MDLFNAIKNKLFFIKKAIQRTFSLCLFREFGVGAKQEPAFRVIDKVIIHFSHQVSRFDPVVKYFIAHLV